MRTPPRSRIVAGPACLGCLIAATIVSAPARAREDFKTYDARTFFDTTSIFGASFSYDETGLLITSDATGIFNVYRQPVAGGPPQQLTFSEDGANFGVSYFPHDDRFLFRADEGGDELFHLYVKPPEGDAIDLTPGEGHRGQFGGWTGDLDGFYILTNERDPQHMDVYHYDAKSLERSMIFENTQGYAPSGVSRDGRWLALAKVRNNADDNIFVVDLKVSQAEPTLITLHEGNVSHGMVGFSIDSTSLRYTSNEASEFSRLWAYDLTSDERSLEQEADWDIMFSSFSWNGRYRVTGVNADAHTKITIFDTTTGQPVEMPPNARNNVAAVSFSRSERHMAFYLNGDTSPSNLIVRDFEATGSHSMRRLSSTLNPKIDENHLVESRVIRYPSFDGLEIPALLYKPKLASGDHPAPALVWVHGGPGGQSRAGYNANIQYLVNHGYAVLAVNNRGSSGYGKTFYHLDDKRHGDVDLKDCVEARRYLESLPWIDHERIGILGGSYGGYMVAAALAFEPEVFDVGVDIFGVTNWIRTLESIPPWWESFREALYTELGDPELEKDRLHAISPLFHAKNIIKPLLVIQGANDPRVLQVESDELVEAVRDNGVPVEYIVFDDEGHGFTNKSNRIQAAESYRDFLDRYLRGK